MTAACVRLRRHAEAPIRLDMTTQMDELTARVASAASIDAEQARRAVDLIFAFLKGEAPGPFAEIDAALPGAAEAAAAGATDQPRGGGLMGGLLSAIGGGGVIGLAGKLSAMGLGTGEITAVGRTIFAYAREIAGNERVDEVAAAIPGLSQFV
jgi:hypothetical protein